MSPDVKEQQINELVKYYSQGNKAKFARLLGVSPQTISTWLSRKSFDIELVYSKCEYLSAEWLLTGNGDMICQPGTQLADIEVSHKFNLKTDHNIDLQKVPLYDIDATAGVVALFSDSFTQTPDNYLSIPDLPPCDGAVHVKGDSMLPILKSGDIILYKHIHNIELGIIWGEMYLVAFHIDDEEYLMIKYIQKSENPDMVLLVSENPKHAPKEIPLHCIRALAMIKASVRYNTMG